MTIVEPVAARAVTGGVDTHLDVHVAAALDDIGGLLGVESFEATRGGQRQAPGVAAVVRHVGQVGVEGTGSYGASLARSLRAATSRWSRSTVPTAKPAVEPASPIPPTRWKPPERRCRAERRARARPAMATSRPSGPWWSPSARARSTQDQVAQPDPPPRLHRPRRTPRPPARRQPRPPGGCRCGAAAAGRLATR